MRHYVPAALLVLSFCLPAWAEDASKAEIFGGYSYARVGPSSDHIGLNVGGNIGLTFRLLGALSFAADASKHWGTSGGIDRGITFLSGGLAYSIRAGESFRPFVHALAGLARPSATIKVLSISISQTENQFAMLFGGGLDFKFRDHWSARVPQAEYVITKKNGISEHDVRVSAGIVYRFR